MPYPRVVQVSQPRLARARIAVSVLFFTNALTLTTWLPRLAEIQRDVKLSDFEVGIALSAGAAGGVLAGVFAGSLIHRFGSNAIGVITLLLILPVLPFIGLAGGVWALGAVLLVIGALDAVMDAAMNTHSMRIQHGYHELGQRRSILNGFHGFWSLGTVAGGLVGVTTAAIGLSLSWSLLLVAIACGVAVLTTRSWLLPGKDPESYLESEQDDDATAIAQTSPDPSSLGLPSPTNIAASSGALAVFSRPMIWGLGAFIIFAVMVEDIPARWSSIYLTSIDTPAALVGWGFVAFTVAMTAGRFLGDRIVDALGERRWTQIAMAASALALGAALWAGTLWTFLLGCAVTGFGVATLFPAAIRAAAHVPGVRPAVGVATVSWLSRAGFVFAPLGVGAIASGFGVSWGVFIAVIAALTLLPLSFIIKSEMSR